jgi:hypothetical protein
MTTKTKAPRNTVENTPTPEQVEVMEMLVTRPDAPVETPAQAAPMTETQKSALDEVIAIATPLAIVSDWTPPANARKGKSERYPFSVLEVGQSFMVPDRTAANFYGTAYSASTRLKVKLSVHDVPDGVMVHRSA